MDKLLQQMADYLNHATPQQLQEDAEYLEEFNYGPLADDFVSKELFQKEEKQFELV